MTNLSVKEQLANIKDEDQYFSKMEELAENTGLTEADQLFILDSCSVSGRAILANTTITSILDKYSDGEDEVLNQGITLNPSLSDAHIQRLGPNLNQDALSNLMSTQGMEKTLKLLGDNLKVRNGQVSIKGNNMEFEIESLISDKDFSEFIEIVDELIFKNFLCKDVISILKGNEDKPLMIESVCGNNLAGIDIVNPIDGYADFNFSFDDTALTTPEIIKELEDLNDETLMYVWIDGDRHYIHSIEVDSDKIVITPQEY